MGFSRSVVIGLSLIIVAIMALFATLNPRPELILSIGIRFIAAGIALYIVINHREWRVLFLFFMFLLMGLRQVLTLLLWNEVIEKSPYSRILSELPGFAVTLLALLSVVYLGVMLAQKTKIIDKQKSDLLALGDLIPVCSQCKSIRDDQGYWNKIESYIQQHSEQQITHSLCGDCTEKLYGDEDWYINSNLKAQHDQEKNS